MNHKQLLDKVGHFKDRDIYKELGVKQSADLQTIKSAYRKKALEYHPDKNKSDAKAVEKFHELQYILEILENGEARRTYNRHFEDQSNRLKERIQGRVSDDRQKPSSSSTQIPPKSKERPRNENEHKTGQKSEAPKTKPSLVSSIAIEALKIWAKERAHHLARDSVAEGNIFNDDIQNFLVKVSTKFASHVPPGKLHGDHYMAGHKFADQFVANKYRHKMKIEAEKSVSGKAEKDFFKYGDVHYRSKIEQEVNKSLKSIMKNMPSKEVSKSVVLHLQKTAKLSLDYLHKEKWGKGASWSQADYKLKLQNVARSIAKEVLVKAENQILADITNSFENTKISSSGRKDSSEGERETPKEDKTETKRDRKEKESEPRKNTKEENIVSSKTPSEQNSRNRDFKRDSMEEKSPRNIGEKEKINKTYSKSRDTNYAGDQFAEKGESQRSWSSKEEEKRNKNRQAWRMM